MGEVPDFEKSGRRPKHSTSEVSIQTLLRPFFSCLPYRQKYCSGSRTVAPVSCLCHVRIQLLNVADWFPSGGRSDKGVWEYTCSLT